MDSLSMISKDYDDNKQKFWFIARGFFIGIIFHFVQLAQSGYNGDSLDFGPYYSTYLGELEQGRYGLLLFSGRIVNPTIEYMGAIALYAIASWLIIEIMGMRIGSFFALLIQAIFMSQSHIANYSTFLYASFPYTLAYFLMILAVWTIKIFVTERQKNQKISNLYVLLSLFMIAASFAICAVYGIQRSLFCFRTAVFRSQRPPIC